MKLVRHHFEVIDSTNTWAKSNAHLLPRNQVTLVSASEQTAGRGRFKRRWESPPGQNVLASFCFFVDKRRQDIGNIPQILAISAAQVLESLSFYPALKWPNDVLLNKKKVAGILAETTTVDELLCLIIGIGLNVNMPQGLLEKIDRPATSLFVEGGQHLSVEEILHLLQKQFLLHLESFLKAGFSSFFEEYKQRATIDPCQKIFFDDGQKIWEGTFHDIYEDGSLSLKLSDGRIKIFLAGEILPS